MRYPECANLFCVDTKRYSAGTGTVKSLTGPFGAYPGIFGLAGAAAFYPPYIQHPVTKDIYTVTDRVYKAVPTASNWTQISPVFDNSNTVYPPIETTNVVSALALAPSDANRVYVGLYNGAIWRSNGPPCTNPSCWTEVAGPNVPGDGLPNAVISSIDVHPTNPNILYITYSGFNLPGGAVWKSTNGGSGVWTQISGGLPSNVPMNVIKVNPGVPTTLWLGADRGVYRSVNEKAPGSFLDSAKVCPMYRFMILR